MRRLLFVVLCFCVIIAKSQERDSVTISISSTDLSENMSVMSTKDDELLFLIFAYTDSLSKLDTPVVEEFFVFNTVQSFVQFNWVKEGDGVYMLFLLEIDSNKPLPDIIEQIKMSYEQLIICHRNNDYNCIEKHLGDEDVLGVSVFGIPSVNTFKGMCKLDRYNYLVEFE